MDDDDKLDAARRAVEALQPRSHSAVRPLQAYRVGMYPYVKSSRSRLEGIAFDAGVNPELIDALIHRAWLARLRLRYVGKVPKPSDAKAGLADLTAAAGKMKTATIELSGALRALGDLNKKLMRWPGSSGLLIEVLSGLAFVCDDLESSASTLTKQMAGRQAETPLDYAVLDALADAWQDAGVAVTFTGRGSTDFQRFAAAAISPHKIALSIYRAVWEAREGKSRRVCRASKK